MAQSFKPSTPYTTPLVLMIPKKVTIKGVTKKIYKDSDPFFCSFKTYGGTENVANDVLSVIDTANIETWYRPDIKADCQVRTETGAIYEIVGEPEDIDMRHQHVKFKVRRVKGGA